MTRWWLRGFKKNEDEESIKFIDQLQWEKSNGDGDFYDRFGRTLLLYACVANLQEEVHRVLSGLQDMSVHQRLAYVNAEVSEQSIVEIGAPGRCTALFAAMTWASSTIVSMLLENGANPYAVDVGRRNVFMYAAFFGRTENLKFWLEKFPKWDLSSRESLSGNTALTLACGFGAYNRSAVKFLLKAGCSVNEMLDTGLTTLMLCTFIFIKLAVYFTYANTFENRYVERRYGSGSLTTST